MKRLSFTEKRVAAGIGLALILFGVANYYIGFGSMGQYRRQVFAACAAVAALMLRYFGPTLQEMRDYRDNKRKQA